MKQFSIFIILAILTTVVSGCSWQVNLVIVNNSTEDIIIEYTKPAESNAQFFASPKTYIFGEKLASLHRTKLKIDDLPTIYSNNGDTTLIHIILRTGEALHIGHYYSFQDREELIDKYNLTLKIGSGTTNGLKHWKNIHTDIIEVY